MMLVVVVQFMVRSANAGKSRTKRRERVVVAEHRNSDE